MQSDFSIPFELNGNTIPKINEMLSAVNNLNSGPSEPPTTFPFMLWANTLNKTLYVRSDQNTYWIELGTLNDPAMFIGKDIEGSVIRDGTIDITKIIPGSNSNIIGVVDGQTAWVDGTANKAVKIGSWTGCPQLNTAYYITSSGDVASYGEQLTGSNNYARADGITWTTNALNVYNSYMIFDNDELVNVKEVIPWFFKTLAIDTDGNVWESPSSVAVFKMTKVSSLSGVAVDKIFSGGDNAAVSTNQNIFAVSGNTIYAQGYNSYGCTGIGHTNSLNTFTALTSSLMSCTDIKTNGVNTYFVDYNNLYAAGQTYTSTVSLINSFDKNISKVQIDTSDSVWVLLEDGELWCKGSNPSGAFGLGDTNSRSTFTLLSGYYFSDIAVFSVGTYGVSCLGVSTDGILYGWGNNSKNQLADGSAAARLTPVASQFVMSNGDTGTIITADRVYSTPCFYGGNATYYRYLTLVTTIDGGLFFNDFNEGIRFTKIYVPGMVDGELIQDINISSMNTASDATGNELKYLCIRAQIITNKGNVYSFGTNYQNSLGTRFSSGTYIYIPFAVKADLLD